MIPHHLIEKLEQHQNLQDHNTKTLHKQTKELYTQIQVLQNEITAYEDAMRPAQDSIKNEINTIHDQILKAWDGEKKTINTPHGTLKFRTTSKLEILNETAIHESLTNHLSPQEVVKYLKGFKLTPLKKYLTVHPQPENIARIETTTTVQLTDTPSTENTKDEVGVE